MKKFIILLFTVSVLTGATAQVNNIKAGLWSDISVWSNHAVPTAADDVILNFSITVDIDADCLSLTLNGQSLTVNSNVHLNVYGDAATTLLSKFIELDTSKAAPLDTLGKTLYYYDNAKRNTGVDDIAYIDGIMTDRVFRSTLFYNGNDTLPFKRIVVTPMLPDTDQDFVNDTSFYYYANGVLTRDSAIDYGRSSILVNRYDYINTGIVVTATSYHKSTNQSHTYIDTINITYLNGNITRQIDTSNFSRMDFQYVYDNNHNPFFRTQSKIALNNFFPYYSMETLIQEVFAKNNALEINERLGEFQHYHYKFVYEYKPNGYPKTVRAYDQIEEGSSYKGLYFYTN